MSPFFPRRFFGVLLASAQLAAAGGAGALLTRSPAQAVVTQTLASAAAEARGVGEPRLDLQAGAARALTPDQSIIWTIAANNGGRSAAYGSKAAWKTFFDSGVGTGVVIFDAVPRFRGLPLALTAPATVQLRGVGNGARAAFYYSAAREIPSAPRDWSAAYLPNAHWIALLLSGGADNVQLPAAWGASSGAGSVGLAQVLIAFTTKQPRGVCANESDAATNMANGVVADEAGKLVGPGIPPGTVDGAVSLAAALGNQRPGSGPLREVEFHVRRRWWLFGPGTCERRLPAPIAVTRQNALDRWLNFRHVMSVFQS